MAGIDPTAEIQGLSIVPVLKDSTQQLRDALYYAYYELGEHAVPQHLGVRTQTHKLFYLPETDEWQMFDLVNDPQEMTNIYGQPSAAGIQAELHATYAALREQYEAPTYEEHAPQRTP